MDRNELKVQALLEKISSLTTNYENQVADLRVEVTVLTGENQALREAADEEGKDEVSQEEDSAEEQG